MEAWNFATQLATINRQLTDLANRFRQYNSTTSAVNGLNLCSYDNGVMIEIFLELTESHAAPRTWWIDISKTQNEWVVDYIITRIEDNGYETIHEETLLAENLEQVVEILKGLIVSINI
jgi:hypothetical protein